MLGVIQNAMAVNSLLYVKSKRHLGNSRSGRRHTKAAGCTTLADLLHIDF